MPSKPYYYTDLKGECPLCLAVNESVRINFTDKPGSHNPVMVNGYPSICPNEMKPYTQIVRIKILRR
jgi:hypothetical protein